MNVFVAQTDDGDLVGVYSSLKTAEAGLLDYVSVPAKPGKVERLYDLDQFYRYQITDFTVDPPDVDEVTVQEIGIDS